MATEPKKTLSEAVKDHIVDDSAELLDMDDEEVLSIKSKLDLREIKLKDLSWFIKLNVKDILPRAYHRYKMRFELDTAPYIERIEEVENQLNDSLFASDPGQVRETNKKVAEMRAQLDELQKECETIEFTARVEEIKYKDGGTLLLIIAPDDVIEAFNRQKMRFDKYLLVLNPVI